MVPHSLSCANSKSDENLKFPENLDSKNQIGHKFALCRRICALPLQPAGKISPREEQLPGIGAPQNVADRRASGQSCPGPPKWQIRSLCSSFPRSAGSLPEQSFKYKQPLICADGYAVAVSGSLPFSVAQAMQRRLLHRTRHLSAAISRGSRSIQDKRGQIAGKGFSDRSTGRHSALHHRQQPQRGHISGDAE